PDHQHHSHQPVPSTQRPMHPVGRAPLRAPARHSRGGPRMSKKPAGTNTANPSPTTKVHPEPTIRMMIVCVPDDLPGAVFDRRQLDRHFGVQGAIAQRFWAKPCTLWTRRYLVDARKGRPTPCAGGPLRQLDLVALRHAYAVGAGLRHQTFTRVVRGTRDARPWVI